MQTRMILWLVGAVLIPLLLVSGGCGSTDSTGAASTVEAASPSHLTTVYGRITGWCLAAGFTGGLGYEERSDIRRELHTITESVEADPTAKSSDGQTVEEILFDLVPTLKKCDPAIALEAEAALPE